ncbi:hypothetical protein J4734_25340 [Klebsiella pneumoniae]|uniref:Uncharacterized protein n=1 Tax=Klebsiella pneumoniae TaxID=573 RepID=A0A939NUR5_KLEPN|nr:hypothetical protein [Klebsiella pneumoniae]
MKISCDRVKVTAFTLPISRGPATVEARRLQQAARRYSTRSRNNVEEEP